MLRLQLFVLSVLHALDVVTTVEALSLGGVEANPFVQGLVGRVESMIAAKFLSMLIVGLATWRLGRIAWMETVCILLLVIGGLAAVVIMNALSIMFLRGMIG